MGLGRSVSSPSRERGAAPAENEFGVHQIRFGRDCEKTTGGNHFYRAALSAGRSSQEKAVFLSVSQTRAF